MPVSMASLLLGLMVAMAEPEKKDSDNRPDISFIEYLGTWETASGKWVDPTQLGDEQPDTKERKEDAEK